VPIRSVSAENSSRAQWIVCGTRKKNELASGKNIDKTGETGPALRLVLKQQQ